MRGEGLLPLTPSLLIALQSNTLEGSPGSDLPFLFEKAQKWKETAHTHRSDVCRLETRVFPLPVERWETSRVGMEGASQEGEGEGKEIMPPLTQIPVRKD